MLGRTFVSFGIVFSLLFIPGFNPLFGKSNSETPDPWSFISKSTCGVDRFLKDQPTADGRGVIIMILDTGVDMGIPGLLTTSMGARKVIDVRDFSGGGDVKTSRPIISFTDTSLSVSDSAKTLELSGLETFNIQPTDSTLEIGIFDEKHFQNSDFRDFDGDGKCQAKFGCVVFKSDSGYVAIVDTDQDGDLGNELPIQSYKKQFQTFLFSKKPGENPALPTCAINIYPNEHKLVFHFDDSSHGTHVAGIAAGHNIYAADQQETFNGIAPGAEIISCKISKGNIGDLTTPGSIARAFLFGAKLSKSQPKPVVINMSFGIPSVIEGQAQIERYIDSLIQHHPNLYVCLSNGNEGPGISSTGLPAASRFSISVGALLNKDIAQNTFGSQQVTHQLWNFSSRGGEVPKPDIVAPGSAHSTVPGYAYRTISSGTSMASPYVAGSIALLLSAIQQDDSVGFANGHYPQRIIKTALKASANPLDGYIPLDYGSGLLNLPKTYQTLKAYRKFGFTKSLVDYSIKTLSPNLGSRVYTPSAYYRSSSLEDIDFKKVFYVSADFPKSYSKKEITSFFRIYQLESNQRWLKPLQKTIFLKGKKQKPISVLYNKRLLKKPGIYHGVITAKASHKNAAKRLRKKRSKDIEFELHNTIIVPYTFTAQNDYQISIPNQRINAGRLKRYYFAVPHYATSFRVKLISNQKKGLNLSGSIVDPNGKVAGYIPTMTNDERFTDEYISGKQLKPGVYEVVVEADRFSTPKSFRFGLEATIESIDISHLETYSDQLVFSITNSGIKKIYGSVTGSYEGFSKTWSDSIYSPQVYRKPIRLFKNTQTCHLKFIVSNKNYNKNTDASLMVVDSSGKKITSRTLDNPYEELFFYHPDKSQDSLTVFFEIHYGFAHADRGDAIAFSVEETHQVKSNILECTPGAFDLYPYIPQRVTINLPSSKDIPPGYKRKGSIRFEDTSKGIFQSKRTFYID